MLLIRITFALPKCKIGQSMGCSFRTWQPWDVNNGVLRGCLAAKKKENWQWRLWFSQMNRCQPSALWGSQTQSRLCNPRWPLTDLAVASCSMLQFFGECIWIPVKHEHPEPHRDALNILRSFKQSSIHTPHSSPPVATNILPVQLVSSVGVSTAKLSRSSGRMDTHTQLWEVRQRQAVTWRCFLAGKTSHPELTKTGSQTASRSLWPQQGWSQYLQISGRDEEDVWQRLIWDGCVQRNTVRAGTWWLQMVLKHSQWSDGPCASFRFLVYIIV